eukprot:3517361-Pyramimonas_sp.AAC.1
MEAFLAALPQRSREASQGSPGKLSRPRDSFALRVLDAAKWTLPSIQTGARASTATPRTSAPTVPRSFAAGIFT